MKNKSGYRIKKNLERKTIFYSLSTNSKLIYRPKKKKKKDIKYPYLKFLFQLILKTASV